MYPNYKLRSEICYVIIVILLFVSGGLFGKTLTLEEDILDLKEQVVEIKNKEIPVSVPVEEYYEIDNMSADEILEYLEATCWTTFYPFEEVHDVYVLGFQRGYNARNQGLWNDIIEEYVDGYYFAESDPLCSLFE